MLKMLIIGNGTSRQTVNLNNIYGTEKIGCNAIFRDVYTDYLVCCDKRMVTQAIAHGHPDIYTRQRWAHDFNSDSVHSLPDLIEHGKERKDDPFHWGSGPYAILLGATMDTNIQIVGFDLYGINGKVNNIYSDTSGYSPSNTTAVDPSYWEYQISKVFNWFPNTHFRIYNTEDWLLPKSWNLTNVSLDKLSNL